MFCGIGGFHYAAQSAGAEVVFASENDPAAASQYREATGLTPEGDITPHTGCEASRDADTGERQAIDYTQRWADASTHLRPSEQAGLRHYTQSAQRFAIRCGAATRTHVHRGISGQSGC